MPTCGSHRCSTWAEEGELSLKLCTELPALAVASIELSEADVCLASATQCRSRPTGRGAYEAVIAATWFHIYLQRPSGVPVLRTTLSQKENAFAKNGGRMWPIGFVTSEFTR